MVAHSGLDELVRLAKGRKISTEQEWLDRVNKQSAKVVKDTAQLPSNQKANALINGL
jgi:hypothetical protein